MIYLQWFVGSPKSGVVVLYFCLFIFVGVTERPTTQLITASVTQVWVVTHSLKTSSFNNYMVCRGLIVVEGCGGKTKLKIKSDETAFKISPLPFIHLPFRHTCYYG